MEKPERRERESERAARFRKEGWIPPAFSAEQLVRLKVASYTKTPLEDDARSLWEYKHISHTYTHLCKRTHSFAPLCGMFLCISVNSTALLIHDLYTSYLCVQKAPVDFSLPCRLRLISKPRTCQQNNFAQNQVEVVNPFETKFLFFIQIGWFCDTGVEVDTTGSWFMRGID